MQTYEAIKNTKNKNSVGPDNLNIRHLGSLAIQYLTDTLNLALKTNTIPQIWKLAKIIPIPKPNKDPNLGTSYRPISLLSPIAKKHGKNTPAIHNFKYSASQTSTWLQKPSLYHNSIASNHQPNCKRIQSKITTRTHYSSLT